MDGDHIANLVRTDDPTFAAEEGWLGPVATGPGGPKIGWTTPDHGENWEAPDGKPNG
jgi:hypothetical protein